MISWQIPSAAPAFWTSELKSPWILHPSFCLCFDLAEHLFPVVRVAFWKPGLQNERNGPRDLCVSICLHTGGHCCWQVRWLHFCMSSSTTPLPLTAILFFFLITTLNAASILWTEGSPKAYFNPESYYSSVKRKLCLLLRWMWSQKDQKLHPFQPIWLVTVAERPITC